MPKTVLIFGTFNPVTNAHIDMGIRAREAYPDACIVYVPARADFLKGWKKLEKGKTLDEKTRLSLLQDAVYPYGFDVSAIEIEGISDGKTYNTAIHFENPIICMGSDKLQELDLWYKIDFLLEKYELLVITRNNYKGKLPDSLQAFSAKLHYVDGTFQEVSSTMVRQAYIDGKLDEVKQYIPDNVYNYLKSKEDLYV